MVKDTHINLRGSPSKRQRGRAESENSWCSPFHVPLDGSLGNEFETVSPPGFCLVPAEGLFSLQVFL